MTILTVEDVTYSIEITTELDEVAVYIYRSTADQDDEHQRDDISD